MICLDTLSGTGFVAEEPDLVNTTQFQCMFLSGILDSSSLLREPIYVVSIEDREALCIPVVYIKCQ